MGHDAYDTQQSLDYVNVYIIYYLIFFTYSKITRIGYQLQNWFLSLEINRRFRICSWNQGIHFWVVAK
jgi:hypothetical protein